MYSYEDRIRAVELYIRFGRRLAATIRHLGYPTKNALKGWYRDVARSRRLRTAAKGIYAEHSWRVGAGRKNQVLGAAKEAERPVAMSPLQAKFGYQIATLFRIDPDFRTPRLIGRQTSEMEITARPMNIEM